MEHRMASAADDEFRYHFEAALGARYAAAEPLPDQFDLEYTPKLQLSAARPPASGGCG
jgi:hypothetical protein